MADLPQSLIDDANADIVGVVSRYVPLKKTGKNWSACCPFHKEKSPSFTVRAEKGFFYCFGCGAGGDAVKFVMEFESLDFRGAVEKIVGNLPADLSQRKEHLAAVSARVNYPDCHVENKEKAHADLDRASIAETHPAFVRWNTASYHPFFVLGNCVAVPLHNSDGDLINVAAINADGRVYYSAGGISYGANHKIDAREKSERRILCMDYFDAHRLWWKMRGACDVLAAISPDNFIWMTRKARDQFDSVAVHADCADEYRELGLDVVELSDAY
jgi:phage/plasmid primase-like uncharacterized protein